MPSPVGHVLAGTAVYLAASGGKPCSRLVLALTLIGSIAPDFDFLPGILIGNMRAFHHGISHSLALALLFGVLSYGIALRMDKTTAVRAGWFGMFAYVSHVTLDLISVNEGTRGVPILWPLLREELGFSLNLFGHFRYGDISEGISSVVRVVNVGPLLREITILGTLVLLLLRKGQIRRTLFIWWTRLGSRQPID